MGFILVLLKPKPMFYMTLQSQMRCMLRPDFFKSIWRNIVVQELQRTSFKLNSFFHGVKHLAFQYEYLRGIEAILETALANKSGAHMGYS